MKAIAVNSMFRTAAAAVAAAVTGCCGLSLFLAMDANPSLFLYDLLLPNRRRQEHFCHQRIWIMGASSGLGAELAKQLASCGASLVLSSRNVDQLEEVATACRALQQQLNMFHPEENNNYNPTIVVLPVDLLQCKTTTTTTTTFSDGSNYSLEQVIDQALQSMDAAGGLDCVIFNAGQGHLSPAMETSFETTERMFRLNVLAPIHATQLLLSKTLSKLSITIGGGGISGSRSLSRPPHLVITSSLGGVMGIPLSASYAASKHALHGYFSSLHAEYPSLRVDIICPGPLATDFHQRSQQQQQQTQTTPQAHQHSEEPRDGTADSNTVPSSSSPNKQTYKMPVERCARLMLSAMVQTQTSKHGCYRCSWVAAQPTLTGMIMNQYVPSWFHQFVLQTMGPVRVQAWKMGLDLYDTASWKRARQALHDIRNNNNNNDDDDKKDK